MTMRVAIVNPVWEPSATTAQETLQRFRPLTGWAGAVAGAGATVTVHQRFSSSATLEHGGVPYMFVRDGGGAKPARVWNDVSAIAASVLAAKPDLAHVNGVTFPEWSRALRRALPASIRIVVQDHGGWDPERTSGWSRFRVRRGLSVMDAVLLASPGHIDAWRAASVVSPGVRLVDVMPAPI
jgi:hypothetical protein